MNFRFGYAGSYARGRAKLNSDLDIVVEGNRTLSDDEYLAIYNKLKQLLRKKFVLRFPAFSPETFNFVQKASLLNHGIFYVIISNEIAPVEWCMCKQE